uniref:Uncharacterized protein n=1 Tax=Oryza rufipogon TaxID=4529 RepID=A0A0E0QUC3_ORYRU
MTREREPRELVNLSAGGATVTGAHSPAPLVTPTRRPPHNRAHLPQSRLRPKQVRPRHCYPSALIGERMPRRMRTTSLLRSYTNVQRRHSIRRPPKHAKQLLHLRRVRTRPAWRERLWFAPRPLLLQNGSTQNILISLCIGGEDGEEGDAVGGGGGGGVLLLTMDGGGVAFYYTGVLYDIRFFVPLDRFIAYSSSGVSSDFRRHAEDWAITRRPGSTFAVTFVAKDTGKPSAAYHYEQVAAAEASGAAVVRIERRRWPAGRRNWSPRGAWRLTVEVRPTAARPAAGPPAHQATATFFQQYGSIFGGTISIFQAAIPIIYGALKGRYLLTLELWNASITIINLVGNTTWMIYSAVNKGVELSMLMTNSVACGLNIYHLLSIYRHNKERKKWYSTLSLEIHVFILFYVPNILFAASELVLIVYKQYSMKIYVQLSYILNTIFYVIELPVMIRAMITNNPYSDNEAIDIENQAIVKIDGQKKHHNERQEDRAEKKTTFTEVYLLPAPPGLFGQGKRKHRYCFNQKKKNNNLTKKATMDRAEGQGNSFFKEDEKSYLFKIYQKRISPH